MTNPIPRPPTSANPGVPVTQAELVAALTHIWDYVLAQSEQLTQFGEMIVSDQDNLAAVAQGLNDLKAKEIGRAHV